MAHIKVRYLISRLHAGRRRYYWQPSKELRRAGFEPRYLPGPLARAVKLAEKLNRVVDGWRYGKKMSQAPVAETIVTDVTVSSLIDRYQASCECHKLAPKTRYDYNLHFVRIVGCFGTRHLESIMQQQVKDFYQDLQRPDPSGVPTRLAMANATLRVFRLLMRFAVGEGYLDRSPLEGLRLVGTVARVTVWQPSQIDLVVAVADENGRPSIGDAVLLALYTGQRQGDILAMSWEQRHPSPPGVSRIRVRQQKTGALVDIPETPKLHSRLNQARLRHILDRFYAPSNIIICETSRGAYLQDSFRRRFSEVRAEAAITDPAIADLWFADLRDTAVTRLAEASCTIPEICSITGHSFRSADDILKHYLAPSSALATSAIEKLTSRQAAQA